MPANIYLVEDHTLIQRMLTEVIHRSADLVVAGVAASAEEALRAIPAADVDLAIVDVSLPDMNGIELVKLLLGQDPALRCLMLSGHQESSYVHRALMAGARGYITKGNPMELLAAIKHVLQGEIYLSPALAIQQKNIRTQK